MKKCENCGRNIENEVKFCSTCGSDFESDRKQRRSLFDRADIQNNKLMAAFAYMGILVLIPIFAAKESKFAISCKTGADTADRRNDVFCMLLDVESYCSVHFMAFVFYNKDCRDGKLCIPGACCYRDIKCSERKSEETADDWKYFECIGIV